MVNKVKKPCYSDYAKHALCFYSRYLNRTYFKNEVEENNWIACDNVLKTYSDRDKDILVYVYGAFDTVGDNVYTMANKYQIHQNIIWNMMKDVERKFAIERGLW